jgi:peroxiredoxin
MMKTLLAVGATFMIGMAVPAFAAPVIGEEAPDFTAMDTNGVEHNLSDFRGKNVVLEWSNPECPFVKKFYDVGAMQDFQEAATKDEDVVWLTIVSSAEGKQGYSSPEEANAYMEEVEAKSTARLLDPSGEIGRLYDAKTTPHMFVIDEEGILVYQGAIDDNDSANSDVIEESENYVMAALTALENGEEIKVASTKPYGCSVKY